jgi:hypothetical protein
MFDLIGQRISSALADSVAFHRDPFNKPELVHTLRGKELILFVILYALG